MDLTLPPFTQERFDAMPALVPMAVFSAWSGLSEEVIRKAVQTGEFREWDGGRGIRRQFYKADLARLTGLKLEREPAAELRLKLARQHYHRLRTPLFVKHSLDLDFLRTWARELAEVLD